MNYTSQRARADRKLVCVTSTEPPTAAQRFGFLPEPASTHTPGRGPMKLQPIAWGKRDPALGKLVCAHLRDANPPTEIPFNPLVDGRIRNDLRKLRVTHY